MADSSQPDIGSWLNRPQGIRQLHAVNRRRGKLGNLEVPVRRQEEVECIDDARERSGVIGLLAGPCRGRVCFGSNDRSEHDVVHSQD